MTRVTPILKNAPAVRARVVGDGTAELLLYGDIGFEVTAAEVAQQLSALGEIETINLRINSFGGDVFQGLAIYNRLAEHRAIIHAYVDGIAASAASFIACVAHDVTMAENATFMVHHPWASTVGTAQDLRSLAERLDAIASTMVQVYSQRSGLTADEVDALMSDETFLDAQQAVRLSFADRISSETAVAARFVEKRHPFRKRPAADLIAPPEPSKASLRLALQAAGLSRRQADRFVGSGWSALDPKAARSEVLRRCRVRLDAFKRQYGEDS